jgi:leucyl-tRNA synthetase
MAPLAPYITEELWERMGQPGSIHAASWPAFDADALLAETLTLAVQVNGRVRGRLEVAYDTSEAEIKRMALAAPRVQAHIDGQQVSRVIYVAGRLVNVVTE